jgi:class 3 adenylate cyclase
MIGTGHYSIAIVDIEKSGSLTEAEKSSVRADLYRLLDSALLESEITSASVIREDRGDGVYLLVPAEVPIQRLIHPFLAVLDAGLAARTVDQPPLRLRTVVHEGQVTVDKMGSSGLAVDLAFALVDSTQVRDALADAPRGRMAVVVQDPIYQSIVRGPGDPDETAFRSRTVDTKRGPQKVWVTVTGVKSQPASRPRRDDGPQPAGRPPLPAMEVQNGDRWTLKDFSNKDGVVGRVDGNVTFGARPGDDR